LDELQAALTERIVTDAVDLGAPVLGYESAGELLAGDPIPPPPELRTDGQWNWSSVLMVGLLALICVLILLIGAVKKCQRKQVDEPTEEADMEHRRPDGSIQRKSAVDLSGQGYQQRPQSGVRVDDAALVYAFGFASSAPRPVVGPGGRAHCTKHLHSEYNPRCEECQKADFQHEVQNRYEGTESKLNAIDRVSNQL